MSIIPMRRFLWLLTALVSCSALSQESPAAEDPNAAVWREVSESMVPGPQTIALLDQGELKLPEGYGFVPRATAVKAMDAMGNQTGPGFVGLIFPLSHSPWFVTVDYDDSGYVKDEEARDWDADGLLKNLREGTEQGNKRREKQGIPPIKVTHWIQSPTYDPTTHQLVWSAEVRLRDEEDPDPGVNYNTYVLGREGYFSLDLVTSASTVESDKPAAKQLLAAVDFHEGKRYEDFNSSTDKVAAYGIAALVGGLAAKKLGLLAVAAAFLAKFAKLILVGIAAMGGGIAKWWKGRSQPQQ